MWCQSYLHMHSLTHMPSQTQTDIYTNTYAHKQRERAKERPRGSLKDTIHTHAHHVGVPSRQLQTQPVNEILPWQPITLTTARGEVCTHTETGELTKNTAPNRVPHSVGITSEGLPMLTLSSEVYRTYITQMGPFESASKDVAPDHLKDFTTSMLYTSILHYL